MTAVIEPKILRGTRDFLPEEMARREYVLNKFNRVFTSFGYDTVQTPAMEFAETLLGKYGADATRLVYRFEDNGGRNIGLRYDHTVGFARLVAANYKTLPMPCKWHKIGRVWRADRPAKGRFREFQQCDIDIIGTKSLLAEAEIARVIDAVFRELGLERYTIKVN